MLTVAYLANQFPSELSHTWWRRSGNCGGEEFGWLREVCATLFVKGRRAETFPRSFCSHSQQ